MIDVKDRVPTKPSRTKITLEDGTVLYATIERADEPVEEGTMINKKLFESIFNNIKYIDIQLTNTVNKYEISKSVIPKSWTRVNYNNYKSQDEAVEILSSAYYSSNYINRAFDGSDSTLWRTNNTNESYAIIKFNTAVRIAKMKIKVYSDNGFAIQASNDNEIWDTLYESSNNISELTEIVLNTNKDYTYYRIYSDGDIELHEMDSSAIISYAQLISLTDLIANYTKNDCFYIQAPENIDSTTPVYININNLGEKRINGMLESGKKYQLIYNGTNFDAHKMWFES